MRIMFCIDLGDSLMTQETSERAGEREDCQKTADRTSFLLMLCCLRKFKLDFVNLICLDSNRLKSILGSFAMLVSSSF